MNKYIKEIPLVSVLMTAYNREKYIAEAIESVLASTYKNFELIIVDDSSKDNTVEIARRYEKDKRVNVYVNEKKLNQFPNRNKAASYAKGKYIKYLDSDDTIYDWGLAYCVEIMEKYPGAGMGLILKNPAIKEEFLLPEDSIHRNFFDKLILNVGPSGTILRTDSFKKLGFYNPNYGVPSDMYFNLQMASEYPIVLLQKDFFFYRIHEKQEYRNKYSYLLNNYRYLHDAFELPNFPITKEQKDILSLKAKKNFVLEFLIYIKNTGDVLKALKAFKNSRIGIFGFLKGILQNL